jgi:hypothetical protein
MLAAVKALGYIAFIERCAVHNQYSSNLCASLIIQYVINKRMSRGRKNGLCSCILVMRDLYVLH